MRPSEPIGPRSTAGERPKHTSSYANSATAAATCTRGSSATRTSSRAGWPQSSRSTPRTGAVYHVLGAPGIASLTAACLTNDRAIDLGRLERLVKNDGEARQRLLFEVAAELYGREQGVSLSELLAELDGEDLDRVLYAIAVVKRRQSASPDPPTISGYAPPNLTRNPTTEADRFPARRRRLSSARVPSTIAACSRRSGVSSLNRCICNSGESCGENKKGPVVRGRRPISRWLSCTSSNCLRPAADASWRSMSRRARRRPSTSPSSSV